MFRCMFPALAVVLFPLSAFAVFDLNYEAINERLKSDAEFRRLFVDHMKTWREHNRLYGHATGVHGFSCPQPVSATVPTSVHSLRPGDIKIVAAMGDSLTAANGAKANNIFEMLEMYRGVAFQIGGDDALETRASVPNVLRKFNPSLFGQSHGVGTHNDWPVAQLNTAIQGNSAHHLPAQAHNLISKMRAHPDLIDMQNDWKLVNIFIGGNDVCHYCGNPAHNGPNEFISWIRQTLNIIRENIPKVIVSLTGVLRVEMVRQLDHNHPFCQAVHNYAECKCEFVSWFNNSAMAEVERLYNEAERTLMMSGEFDTTDDFTLVWQPVLTQSTQVPKMPNGDADMSYFTPDCFHFSAKLHSIVAQGLWNNLVSAVGQKATSMDYSGQGLSLQCPDPACPFIRTTKNSANCTAYLTPPAQG